MSKEIYISSTPHETRLAIVENDALTEIYYERENEYTLAGSIYNGKVTRVLPGMQSSFVDIGLERDAFLYITDFMEEEGDSADFDTSGNSEGRGRRDGGRDRSPAALPAPEGSTLEATDEPAARPERTGDRNGRDRGGRGRRDRNRSGNRDRQPRPDGIPTPVSAESTFDAPEVDFSRPTSFASDSEAPLPDRLDTADLGEGAPGADGSRRWRGRRGRRRGRGPGQRDESPQVRGTSPNLAPEAGLSAAPPDYEVDEDSADIDLDAHAAAPVTPRNTAPIDSAYGQPTQPSSDVRTEQPRRDRDRGGRGDRGGRNRGDRGGRDRGGRPDDRAPRTDDRAPRVPRGFAPKASLYGVDNTPAYGQSSYGDAPEAPAGEPLILPGESLSKYRKGGEETPAAKPAFTPDTIIIPASSGFTVSSDWDGGSVLPGETLSRHRRSEPQQSRPEPRRTEPRAEHRIDTRAELRTPTPAPVPVAPVEYEPTEASASYRIDPVAQSEFRQSAPVIEVEPETEASSIGTQPFEPLPVEAQPVETQPVEEVDLVEVESVEILSPVHTITPPPTEPLAPLHTESDAWDWQQPSVAAPEASPAHDVTNLQSTGEMISAPPAIESADAVGQDAHQPADPILHETAILTPIPQEYQAAPPVHEMGEGVVEEEELVEDEHIEALNASSIEELDDLDEEETLEGAADLGTMIREMSIDQITRPAEVEGDTDLDTDEDDYEDFEEEDSVDDNLEPDSEEADPDSSHDSESYEEESGSEPAFRSDAGGFTEEMFAPSESRAEGVDSVASPSSPAREGDRSRRREGGRRDGRRDRDNRRDGRDRDRSRNTGGAGDRERSGGRGRQSMQSTNLPAISDLLKPGQEVLVQIAKEPIAKKGARITSHIALPGRFLVFMPTVNHTGVSRKIESDAERRRLKEILLSEKGEASGGFIVRTAASGATEEELRSDLRFLLNLWADIKTRSESSKSPALIYHDLNLVERILRDQVTDNFSAIWVDTETDYERILRFLQRFQPALIRRVKLYTKETPLFEQFGITEEINKALRSKVWLKSGGSIVINQTEALVAIDINTGKFVGKTARLEDTIVKTNLDAIPEIVRQIRLRDLGGIIIIDFIDMDERKNRNRVMAALEEELKSDRAPSKVLQFNDFGLVAITRKRVKQSLERTLSTTCNVCVGTGMVKSPITVCNDIYIEMRKMNKHLDRGDVMLRVHPEVVKALKSTTSRWLQEMEEMVGKTILVKSDPTLHPEQFDIH